MNADENKNGCITGKMTLNEDILASSEVEGSSCSEEGIFMDTMEDCEECNGSDTLSVDSINSTDVTNCHNSLLGVDIKPDSVNDDVPNKVDTELAESFKVALNFPERRNVNLHLDVDPEAQIDKGDCKTPSDSPGYGDDDFEYTKPKLRKASSLKTNKTPPGTPHRKKIVRFADVMGLDLEDVVHILNKDSPPQIPSYAWKDIKFPSYNWNVPIAHDAKYLSATFQQPSYDPFFLNLVSRDNVRLENTVINDLTISGIIRVSNVGYHKLVKVRYTLNGWVTYYDITASYVPDSSNGSTDRFSFVIRIPNEFRIGGRVEFAVSYNVNSQTYWDSNNGSNYAFECQERNLPSNDGDAWLHFM